MTAAMTPEIFEASLALVPNDCAERVLGGLLRERRIHLGLTQKAVARAAGLRNQNFVSMMETGESKVPPERATALAAALGLRSEPVVRRAILEHRPALSSLMSAG